MKKLILLFLAPVLLLAASSDEIALQLDPAQTKVEFTLGDVLHTVHGKFALRRGNIHLDPVSGNASGELVVDAASGDSGSHARDRRMHANVLESGRYPEIVFRPDRVTGKVAAQGTSNVEVHGIFVIHGTEHEMTAPVEVTATNGEYSAMAHFAIPYVKWGMKNPSTLFLRVSENVEITVHMISRRAS
jgi:polyisoprenoid-binding protein YceI